MNIQEKNIKNLKWIIDTDIGDDIDDAYAIEYAIKSNFDVAAITTVFRAPKSRAKLTKYLTNLMGKDIKVYAGIDKPLVNDLYQIQKKERYLSGKQLEIYQNDDEWLPQLVEQAKETKYDGLDAVEKTKEIIENGNGDVGIVAIGPLTNIATLIEKYPSLKEKIPVIVIMGTTSFGDKPEYNIKIDPEAAKIVFGSNIKIIMVPCDVTLKTCSFDAKTLKDFEKLKYDLCCFNRDILEKWKNTPLYNNRMPCMHDALVFYVIRQLDRIKTIETSVEVDLNEPDKGMTRLIDKSSNNIKLVLDVDKDIFINDFMKVISR